MIMNTVTNVSFTKTVFIFFHLNFAEWLYFNIIFQVTESNPPSSALNDVALTYMKYEHKIEQSLRLSQKEAHQKRMQSMRKELDYLNGTAWQFESADKGF